MCAAIGLSFTACDPKQAPEPDPQDVAAPDPLIGLWHSVEVTHFDDVTYTMDRELTIEEDLSGALASSSRYDAPGTAYDEDYDYDLTLTAMALGGAKYRLDFRDPTEPPERPGSLMTCTITGTTLACDPDDPVLDNMTFEREA